MKIYLARHGRTNYNDLGLCNADPAVDVHLTPAGIQQSQALADKLKPVHFDRIFVSQLKRTQQTAEIVHATHSVAVEIDPRLNDGRSGYEGKHFQEYEQALDAAPDKWTARFNGGESIEDIRQRVADFVQDLRGKGYGSVLVVTSSWIVQAMCAVVHGLTNEQARALEPEQGSYLELEI